MPSRMRPPGLPFPPPANVEMIPAGVTLRTLLLTVSAMNTLPFASTATADGPNRVAFVAGPPSPSEPACPVPATVVMVPARLTLRTVLSAASAMNKVARRIHRHAGWLHQVGAG